MTKTRLPILATAIMLFALGFLGRIALHDYHNFETIMVSVFLASMLLPASIAMTVTLSMIVLSDMYLGYFGASKIIIFTYTGFLIVSMITSRFQHIIRGEFKPGTVYKFTASGLIFATIYDTWTNFGVFWLSYAHTPENLVLVYILGLPFMIYHLLSSIITFTVLGFPIYCALSSKADDPHILNQRKELEI